MHIFVDMYIYVYIYAYIYIRISILIFLNSQKGGGNSRGGPPVSEECGVEATLEPVPGGC
jgi:hypothetical protein